MGLEEQLLTESIRNTLAEAGAAKTKLNNELEAGALDDDNEPRFAVTAAQDSLDFQISKAYRDLTILAERLGLPCLRAEIVATRDKHPDLTNLISTDYDVALHSPPLADAWAFFDSMAAMTAGRAVSGLGVFESILHSTGQLIADRKLEPKNEKDVRAEVLKVLKLAFNDVAREVSVGKPLKIYKPDIGVPALMAAAEYKFIDSPTEATAAVGGIYEDMVGYRGRHEWRNFYAVFYMTKPFFTQKQLDEEWRVSKVETSWKGIVVSGPGGRPRKAKPAE